MAKCNLKDDLRCVSPRDDDLEPVVNVLSNDTKDEDDDDFEELTLPSPPKIDISTLKNEILTDGMKVSTAVYMHVNRGIEKKREEPLANHIIVPRGSHAYSLLRIKFGGLRNCMRTPSRAIYLRVWRRATIRATIRRYVNHDFHMIEAV